MKPFFALLALVASIASYEAAIAQEPETRFIACQVHTQRVGKCVCSAAKGPIEAAYRDLGKPMPLWPSDSGLAWVTWDNTPCDPGKGQTIQVGQTEVATATPVPSVDLGPLEAGTSTPNPEPTQPAQQPTPNDGGLSQLFGNIVDAILHFVAINTICLIALIVAGVVGYFLIWPRIKDRFG